MKRERSTQVQDICAFIRSHYHENISLRRLASSVGRNPAYMSTLFHRQTGMTIRRYVTRIRMRRAGILLRRGEKVEAVMLQVGYQSKKNFYRQFVAAFGVTPGHYKSSSARFDVKRPSFRTQPLGAVVSRTAFADVQAGVKE